MKTTSYKKPRLTGNIFAPKTKLMRCRRREKEDRTPGQKVRRRSSSWHQLGVTTSAASRGAHVKNTRGHRPPSPQRGQGCSSTECMPRCAVVWQRLCLQPEEPLVMVSQGEAWAGWPGEHSSAPKLTGLSPLCLLNRSGRW